ncbi:hypothetical protein [Pseudonocardia lacus]|uniref:hypothetical protein n=1 Tax=Pseudonocardia lacus TaxID=2835865 RepID=UPI001BDD70EB|nr:hypothetical protein [Pseudonocardia lacus]
MTRHASAPGHPPLPPPVRAPSGLRRHGWLAVLVVGAALFYAVVRTMVGTDNPNFVPSAILLGAAVTPAALVAFVYGRRLPYRVSRRRSPPRPCSAA